MLRPVLSRPAVGKYHAAAVDVRGVRDDSAGETMDVPASTRRRRRGGDPATAINSRRIIGDKHAIIAVSDGSPPRRGEIGRCWAAHRWADRRAHRHRSTSQGVHRWRRQGVGRSSMSVSRTRVRCRQGPHRRADWQRAPGHRARTNECSQKEEHREQRKQLGHAKNTHGWRVDKSRYPAKLCTTVRVGERERERQRVVRQDTMPTHPSRIRMRPSACDLAHDSERVMRRSVPHEDTYAVCVSQFRRCSRCAVDFVH